MIPHEREMVKRLQGKPFTLLGINSDQDRSALQRVQKSENITWPSIWGGPPSNNAIARRWNIRGWPSVIVIDKQGVIRYRDVRDVGVLEQIVDNLIKEVPASAASEPSSRPSK